METAAPLFFPLFFITYFMFSGFHNQFPLNEQTINQSIKRSNNHSVCQQVKTFI